jgi:hypothetical protein
MSACLACRQSTDCAGDALAAVQAGEQADNAPAVGRRMVRGIRLAWIDGMRERPGGRVGLRSHPQENSGARAKPFDQTTVSISTRLAENVN